MKDALLVPSIEHRLHAWVEMTRRKGERGEPFRHDPAVVTISREFGCEAFPVAERLKGLLEAKTGSPWILMEKELLEKLEPSAHVGNRYPFFDDLMSVLSAHWRSDKDEYLSLCKQITSLASHGNIIFVGRGCSVLLQERKNTYHFRMVARMDFKVASICRRLQISPAEAEELISRRQQQREEFIRDFLNRDVRDPCLYHLVINNGKNDLERIARTIEGYVPPE